jgi:uncharacterized membrane protein
MKPAKSLLFSGAFTIGVVAGLRSFTALALISWAAHLGWLDLHQSRLSVMGKAGSVALLSLFALGELIADKMPRTPSRTAPGPLGFRIFSGALSGAALCIAAQQSWMLGAVLGGAGAIIGSYGGYHVRHHLTKNAGLPDLLVALVEDVIAVGGGFLLLSHLR